MSCHVMLFHFIRFARKIREKTAAIRWEKVEAGYSNVTRLRAVSLLLENPRGKVAEHESRASGKAASSARGGRLPPRALLAASLLARDSCSASFSPRIFEKKRLLAVYNVPILSEFALIGFSIVILVLSSVSTTKIINELDKFDGCFFSVRDSGILGKRNSQCYGHPLLPTRVQPMTFLISHIRPQKLHL